MELVSQEKVAVVRRLVEVDVCFFPLVLAWVVLVVARLVLVVLARALVVVLTLALPVVLVLA